MVLLVEGIFASSATARRASDKEPRYVVGDQVPVKDDNLSRGTPTGPARHATDAGCRQLLPEQLPQ